MSDRERFLELWAAHLLGVLDAADRAALDAYLARGEEEPEMAELEKALSDLAASAPPEMPSPDLRRRVLAATRPAWRTWAAAAAVLLIAVGAGWWFWPDESDDIRNAPGVVTIALDATAGGPGGSVYYDPATERAVIVLDGKQPPTRRDYELWAIEGGVPRSLGVVSDRTVIVRGLETPAAFAVSEEAEGGSTTGKPDKVVSVGAVPS